jgi:N-acyl homoserine lactone hydrolase
MPNRRHAGRLQRAIGLAAPVALATLVALGGRGAARAAEIARAGAPPAPPTVRLYVFDCGVLNMTTEGVERYHVTPAEVGETRMAVPCFLVAHPRGTLLWDVGVIPDTAVEGQRQGARSNVNPTTSAVVTRTLRSQLARIGYTPADIRYVAISHAHIDHSANLNEFAASTWITRPAQREFMWAENNPRVNPSFYTLLKNSASIVLVESDEHDVFGDGQVIIKSAPGHTPGHQVLILRLAATGRVMLSGDLYHYPAERAFHRAPPDNEFSVEASAASRARIEEYLQRTKTELWIEHDFGANARLKKSPDYYD